MLERQKRHYALREPTAGDMEWVVESEGALYSEEFGFDGTFKTLVGDIVADFVAHFDAARERCWIAESDGNRVGHVFLVKHPNESETARLRLLLVLHEARGLGLGNALVHECLSFARSAGYRKITLWTQSILIGACKIYAKAGFRLVAEKPHHSWGKDLVGQTWEVEL